MGYNKLDYLRRSLREQIQREKRLRAENRENINYDEDRRFDFVC